MRTETYTITKTYYNYDELSQEAKENVREQMIEIFCTTDGLYSQLIEDIKYDFPNSELDVEFQLSYCQGDGLNIYGTMDFIDSYNLILREESFDSFTEEEQEYLKLLSEEISDCKLNLKSNGRYGYCTVAYNDFEWDIKTEIEEFTNIPVKSDIIKKYNDLFIEVFEGYCDRQKEYGYNWLYEMEWDEVEELVYNNDYEFDEDGNLMN